MARERRALLLSLRPVGFLRLVVSLGFVPFRSVLTEKSITSRSRSRSRRARRRGSAEEPPARPPRRVRRDRQLHRPPAFALRVEGPYERMSGWMVGGERRRETSLRNGVHHANAVVWGPVYRTHLRARRPRRRLGPVRLRPVVVKLRQAPIKTRRPRALRPARGEQHLAQLHVRKRLGLGRELQQPLEVDVPDVLGADAAHFREQNLPPRVGQVRTQQLAVLQNLPPRRGGHRARSAAAEHVLPRVRALIVVEPRVLRLCAAAIRRRARDLSADLVERRPLLLRDEDEHPQKVAKRQQLPALRHLGEDDVRANLVQLAIEEAALVRELAPDFDVHVLAVPAAEGAELRVRLLQACGDGVHRGRDATVFPVLPLSRRLGLFEARDARGGARERLLVVVKLRVLRLRAAALRAAGHDDRVRHRRVRHLLRLRDAVARP
eukprot:30507-Pelagococcus_subviridis.AAC.6